MQMDEQELPEEESIFTSNMRQIDTTNRLLAHIEDKLNNLIVTKKPLSQPFDSIANNRSPESFQKMPVKDSKQNISNQQTKNDNFFSKENSYLQQKSARSKYGNNSSMNDYNGYTFNRDNNLQNNNFNKNNRSINDINQFSKGEDVIFGSNVNSNKRLNELNELLLGKDEHQGSKNVPISSGVGGTLEYTKSPQQQDMQEHEPQISCKLFSDDGLGKRVEKMDKFYEQRMRLLGDRVGILEAENKLLVEQRGQLHNEVSRLRECVGTSNGNNGRYSDEKQFEFGGKRTQELEEMCKKYKEQVSLLSREKSILVDSLQKEIKDLKQINLKLEGENTILRNKVIDGSGPSSSINNKRNDAEIRNHSFRNDMQYGIYGNSEGSEKFQNESELQKNIGTSRKSNRSNQDRNSTQLQNNKEEYRPQYYSESQTIEARRKEWNEMKENIASNQNDTLRQKDIQIESNYLQKSSINSNLHTHQQSPNYLSSNPNNNYSRYNNHSNNNTKFTSISQNINSQNDRTEIDQLQNTKLKEAPVSLSELQKIREELSRQQEESNRMAIKIEEFKENTSVGNRPFYSSPSSHFGVNSQQHPPQILESQLLLENYRLYAQQLEKSYDKLESVYQRDAQDKQQLIFQLQQSLSQSQSRDRHTNNQNSESHNSNNMNVNNNNNNSNNNNNNSNKKDKKKPSKRIKRICDNYQSSLLQPTHNKIERSKSILNASKRL